MIQLLTYLGPAIAVSAGALHLIALSLLSEEEEWIRSQSDRRGGWDETLDDPQNNRAGDSPVEQLRLYAFIFSSRARGVTPRLRPWVVVARLSLFAFIVAGIACIAQGE